MLNEQVESVMAIAFELARIREEHGAQSGMYLSEVRALRAEVERLAAQAAPTEAEYNPLLIDGVQHDPLCLKVYRSPLKECDCGASSRAAQPSQAPVVQAVQATQAVRMLTEDEQAAIIDMHSTGRAQGDHECAEDIQHKFAEVNGLRIPADGKIGSAA